MGSGASTPLAAIQQATPEQLHAAMAGMTPEERSKITMALQTTAGPVDIQALKLGSTVAKNLDGLLPQPANPLFKVALVGFYQFKLEGGGSDKNTSGHRFDAIPMANGFINAGMSCQVFNYVIEEHDLFFETLARFDAVVVRINPGQIQAAGGDQNKFDADMSKLAAKIQVWPTPGVMATMGAKDALVHIKDMDFGLPDTYGYYSPEDIRTTFRKSIAFQPRVVKQNRGSAGEGIWIVKLKDENYCPNLGDRECTDEEVLVLKEANDNHVEEHTIGEFLEFCINGRNDKSGEWTSKGTGMYFEGGKEAGGQMVDQRFLPGIDDGEARFFMINAELYNIEHYVYIGGVSGETKTTVFGADAPEYQAIKEKLQTEVGDYMKALGLGIESLPLLWAADFIPVKDHKAPLVIGEFNCSCLGITGFLAARGKDMSVIKPEDYASGMKMCDAIGTKALEALKARTAA